MTQPSQIPSSDTKTSIDSLVELLTEKGKMDLNSISITLDVSPMIVEEWAKVLEAGKLVRVSYEVGKMFLEIVSPGSGTEQGKSAAIKTETQKSILQGEMEVEKITLDKFSKSLEDLAATAAGMETLYRQKMPNIQKLFAELDAMSAPMARKTKELSLVQKEADAYFSQLDKKTDALYAKIQGLEGTSVGRALRDREGLIKTTLSRADQAKASLVDLEDTRQALYSKISLDIDKQVKEYKSGLKTSLDQIYADIKLDATEAVNIDREIRKELAETAKATEGAMKMKKEADASRAELLGARSVFKQKYQAIVGELEKASSGIDKRYASAQQQLEELKTSMGEMARLHDSLVAAKGELATIQKSIQTARADVATIIQALKTMETLSKKMGDAEKEKAVGELARKSKATKEAGEQIKKSLNAASDSLQRQSEGKK